MTAIVRVWDKNLGSFCIQFPFTLSMPFIFRLFSYFSFMSDIELIDTCRKLIQEKFHLPGNGSWKQRDFQYLSDLIMDRTGARISLSTLKRIWKETDNHLPQLYTLNALAQVIGFNSWNDFKKGQTPDVPVALPDSQIKNQQSITSKTTSKKYWLIFSIILVLGVLATAWLFNSGNKINPDDVIFKSRKNIAAGVPNTVVFEYDISKTGVDSALIQQSWDERFRARVSRNNHWQTFIYYYPGFHTARLIIDKKVIKTEKVNISTNGWEALVDGDVAPRTPFYLPKQEIISEGRLYVSKQTLLKNEIPVIDKEYQVNFFKVGNLPPVNSNNFIFNTRIKNSLAEGALVCQNAQVNLLCENGFISIPFCNPGCASNIHLHVSDVFKSGKNFDLSAFGTDLSEWRKITIQCINKNMTIYIDDQPVYHLAYSKDLGPIAGFHFSFLGCGAVDEIHLTDDRKVTYGETF
jgi:hypothetical protein